MEKTLVRWHSDDGTIPETLDVLITDIEDNEVHQAVRAAMASACDLYGGRLVYIKIEGGSIMARIEGAPIVLIEHLEEAGWTW